MGDGSGTDMDHASTDEHAAGDVLRPARGMRTRSGARVLARPVQALEIAGLAIPVLLLAWKAWDRRWMSDDGLINLRVVDQVLAGNGPVFNAGERVEAATSPLWIAILVIGDVLTPVRLEWLAVLAGIGLTLVGLVAAIWGSARLWGQVGDGVLVPVGAACLAVLSPVWDFSSSGLEGGLSFCWLGVSLLVLQRWASAGHERPVAAPIVAGLGPVIRPDFAVISLILIGVLVIGEWSAPPRRRGRLVALALAVPVAYQAFRIAYYGALVPNTYFAKEGGEGNWSQGWLYLRDFVGPYHLWLPVAVLGLAALIPLAVGLRRQGEERAMLVAVAFPLAGLVSALAIVRGGGDFMHGRMLLPSLFAIVAPVATVALRRRTAPAALVLPWAVVCLVALGPKPFTPDQLDGISDHRAGLHMLLGEANLVTLEDFGFAPGGINHFELDGEHRLYYGQTPLEIDGRPVPLAPGAPDRVVLAYGVGAIGYFAGTDTYVLDMLGLGDVMTARLALDRRGPLPGHEKSLPAPWVWARLVDPGVEPQPGLFPPPAVLAGVSPTLDADATEDELAQEVDVARVALGCHDIAELVDATRGPLGPGQVLSNVAHAVTSFRLRIPPRPTDAYDELC